MNQNMGRIMRYILIVTKLNGLSSGIPAKELLRFLDYQMSSRGYPPGLSERSLQRDIKDIEEIFRIRIRNRRGVGYYIDEWDKKADERYEVLLKDFDMLTSTSSDFESMGYIVPEHHRPKGYPILFDLLDLIKGKEIIRFDYTLVRNNNKVNHKQVKPYFLKESQSLWYLVAVDEDNKLKLFGIDRISKLYSTGRTFKRDENIDCTNMFRDCYGIWDDPDMPVEEIELKYSPLDGSFLKSNPLHWSQQILNDDDTEFRIRLNIRITNDFVMALLSRSGSLTVIKPLHLRERIAEIYSKAFERNK